MPQKMFDDAAVRAAMRSYLDAADRLDELAALGGEARDLLDVAERKAMAGMTLRQCLQAHGWTAPAKQGEPTSTTPS